MRVNIQLEFFCFILILIGSQRQYAIITIQSHIQHTKKRSAFRYFFLASIILSLCNGLLKRRNVFLKFSSISSPHTLVNYKACTQCWNLSANSVFVISSSGKHILMIHHTVNHQFAVLVKSTSC